MLRELDGSGATFVTTTDDSRSRWAFIGSHCVLIPLSAFILIAACCFLLPQIAGLTSPVGGDASEANLPWFSPEYLLGTDLNGNDVLSRLMYGGRASLRVALAVNLLGLIIGGLLGSCAGYAGGILDSIAMRAVDVLIAFPSLVLALTIAQSLGPSELNTIWALAFFSIPAFARVSRAATLRLRALPFMTAAKLSGTSHSHVLFRHIAPIILPQLITFAILGMGVAIVLEGALSFLGLGIPLPQPSWGNMIAHGNQAIFSRPSLVMAPGALLFGTVLSLNLLSESLRLRRDTAQSPHGI